MSGASGPLGARLYVPDGIGEHGGLLVYFHGGGFVVCDLETHDNTCRFLAVQAGVPVLSVDYRRAPEHRFPAAIEDALAAFRFAVGHAVEFGAVRLAWRSAVTAPAGTSPLVWLVSLLPTRSDSSVPAAVLSLA